METTEETPTGHNMVSNLPLLFTGGYPTSLENISDKELEMFIPFMVQCSLGVGNGSNEIIKPDWWPSDLSFEIPLTRPENFTKDEWLAKMKEVVVICYKHHNSIFLLRFCNELSGYQRACLRFIDNYNMTTSLYERVSNRLLVTFRNENMLYDKQQNGNIRRCLLPRNNSSQSMPDRSSSHVPEQTHVLFDIYLCDNCDAELYSLEAYKDHEKGCQSDDDVIICDPDDEVDMVDENHQRLTAFLSNFNLQSTNPAMRGGKVASPMKEDPRSPEKFSRIARRAKVNGVIPLARCPTIPFSSPLGQFLIDKSKTSLPEEYSQERLERIERFAYAPTLLGKQSKPKSFDRKGSPYFPVSFKKSSDHPRGQDCHFYKFPRRQLSTKNRDADLEYLNGLMLRKCRPCSVSIKKLSEIDVNNYNMKMKLKRLNNNNYRIVSNKTRICNTITNTSNGASSSSSNTPKSEKDSVVEYIDLCSSDDDEPQVVSVQHLSSVAVKHKINPPPAPHKLTFQTVSNPFAINHNNNTHPGPGISLPKPLQPSVYLFSNLNTTTSNSSFYDKINLTHHQNHVKENNILKISAAARASLVKVSTPSSSSRGLTANL